ncbi:Lactate-binding periplasmic protein precursor [Labrenzia sp. THAF35]|jgi:TRAP-type mannitol/chloroaromatic compound transport system substrate-binding protein|uniref:TRAP transporter substrate-binding protein n=1 Tax=Labrenzia sp. THAF35 TaxID=2587854 RepID=UPI001268B302|nr:TRAP transporter substrate-binding protein [Labrenzia sp. THAF35]QFT67923.1 Lactate-binding periplasmic protein precursor [Labrenzia sp. THAF35]
MADHQVNSTRRGFLTASAGAVAATALAAPPAIAQSNVTWQMQTHWPTGNWYYEEVFVKFCNRITEATNGELTIKPVPNDGLVRTGEVLDGVRRGLLESAFIYPAYWIGRIPVAGHLNGFIGTWDKHEEMAAFMYEMGALDIIREAYAEQGVYQAGPVSYAGLTLYSNRPLRTTADFAGWKVRSTGPAALVFSKMGATPVSIPGAELYQGLQTGVVDGAHWGSTSTGWGMNLQEVNKYIVRPDLLGHLNGEVLVSLERWNSIGTDLQATFNEIVRATSADASAHFLYRDMLYTKEFIEEMNGELSQLDEEALMNLHKYSLEVVDEYSEKDPKYCGRVGEMLHEFQKLRGIV